MKSIITFWLLFLGCATISSSQGLTESMQPYTYLLGEYSVEVLLPSDEGRWIFGGKGEAMYLPVLDGTFIQEHLVTRTEHYSLTMINTLGKDPRTGNLRVFASDKEFGTMDIYEGEVQNNSVIVSNLNSDVRFQTDQGSLAFRLSYSFINEHQHQLIVESTADDGQSWQPYVKHIYKKQTVKYFTKLTGIISPYCDYKPRGLINKHQATLLSHYKVVYDHRDRIISIQFFKRERAAEDSYFAAHEVRYRYLEDNRLIRSYYDSSGKPANMWRHYYMGGDIHTEEFILDKNGYKVRLLLRDSTGARVVTDLGSYEYFWETLNDSTFIQKQVKRDGSENILTEYFPFTIAQITMDQNGHLSHIIHVDESGNMIDSPIAGYADVVFNFDDYGNELGWKFVTAEGERINRKAYRQTDFGYAEWSYFTQWENRSLGLIHSWDERYFGEDGQPANNNFGVHEVKYKVNEWGNLDNLEYYDTKGEKVNHKGNGYFRLEFIYNDLGKRTGTRSYDALGKLIN